MKPSSLFFNLVLIFLLPIVGACNPEVPNVENEGDGHYETVTLMVYNVENVFDLDGVSLFGDYVQDSSQNPFPYNAKKLLTKIQNHTSIVAEYDDGKGPDILAIQEFENDFSQDSEYTLVAALEKYKDVTVEALLTTELLTSEIKALPVSFFFIKQLIEIGFEGYEIGYVEPTFDPSWQERTIAHQCVYLSRFPVVENGIKQHPMKDARDILEVTFDVHGNPFTIFNNHWKSGASSPRSEPTRVENAKVLRMLVEQALEENPDADIALVGDFNCHHNQRLRMPESVATTGLNDILKSQSSERALIDGRADLYNLWYELPQQQRGSEVWKGEWGTLMQIIITPGLYDTTGIQYVDQSFERIFKIGKNVSDALLVPDSWVTLGNGSGYSDHLPVAAKFRVSIDNDLPLPNYDVATLGDEVETVHIPVSVDYSLEAVDVHQDLSGVLTSDEFKLGESIGKLFDVKAQKSGRGITIEGYTFGIYAPKPEVSEWVKSKKNGESMHFVGEFGIYRGNLQFLIQDVSWILHP